MLCRLGTGSPFDHWLYRDPKPFHRHIAEGCTVSSDSLIGLRFAHGEPGAKKGAGRRFRWTGIAVLAGMS